MNTLSLRPQNWLSFIRNQVLNKYTVLPRQKQLRTPVNGKVGRDSVQCPLEGYKCLGGHFKFLISMHSPNFLFFIPLKGVLKRVTENLE